MGRERRQDGRATVTPPQRVEVDLTSVCVRRGSVQLPYRMQGVFDEGSVAAVDAAGGALELYFQPPRELAGLRDYFQHNDLGVNDAIALVLDAKVVRIEAVKRERRPARSGRVGAGSAPPATEPRASTARSDDSGPDAPPARRREHPSRSAAPSAPPSLRLEVPEASVPIEGARPESATPSPRSSARWEPLDVTATRQADGGAEAPEAPGAAPRTEPATSWVREVRRTRPRDSAEGPQRAPPPDVAEAPVVPRTARPTPEGVDGGREHAHGELPEPPAQGRGLDLFGLRRRLGIGRAGTTRVVPADDVPARAGANAPRTVDQRPAGPRSAEAAPGPALHRPAAQAPLVFDGPEAALERAGEAAAVATASAPEAAQAAAAMPVEDDVRVVASFLARPDIPAIVRAERVAEALGLTVARADAALDRIAEDSDRLSPIRARAYMLRQRDQG